MWEFFQDCLSEPWLYQMLVWNDVAIATVASVITAFLLMGVIPMIKELPSSAQQRKILENAVEERTKEKDILIKQINHRIGNQLQVMLSIINLETREKNLSPETSEILTRMQNELYRMVEQHTQLSQQNYNVDKYNYDINMELYNKAG